MLLLSHNLEYYKYSYSMGWYKVKIIGIDICDAGWLCVCIQNDIWEINILNSIEEIINQYGDSELFLTNIPIGLMDDKDERSCDLGVRKIFSAVNMVKLPPTPCREALCAENFGEANRINRKITGKQLPSKIWDIAKEIIDINEFLFENHEYRSKFKECNTELNFAMLGRKPMRYNKVVLAGYKERKEILERIYPNVTDILDHAIDNFRRRDVKAHNVLDAICLALGGYLGLKNGFYNIPSEPQYDSTGLKMEISIGKHDDLDYSKLLV